MSNLTREQVEAYVGGTEKNDCRIPCPECAAEPICDGVFGKYELATQLIATMDALTTAEARIEAALVLSDVGAEGEKRGERVGPQFAKGISAILRGERDE
jgi:hypothetical protein